MKKVLGKIASVLSYVLLFAALLLLGIVFTARVKGDIPSVGGYSVHVVATGSMSTGDENGIDQGDAVIIKSCSLAEINVGDVVLFRTDDPNWQKDGVDLVLHRAIALNTDDEGNTVSLTTMGDASTSQDEYPAVRVVGVLKRKSTFIGSILTFFVEGKNALFLIGIIVLTVVIAVIARRLVQAIKDEEEGKSQIDDDAKKRIQEEIVAKLLAEKQQHSNDNDRKNS